MPLPYSYALCNRKCLRKLPSAPCQHPINVSHRESCIPDTARHAITSPYINGARIPITIPVRFCTAANLYTAEKNQNAAEDDQKCCQPPFYIFFFQIEFHTFTSTPIYYNNSLVKSCPFLFLVDFSFFSCLRVEFMHILCIIITCYKFLFITCL